MTALGRLQTIPVGWNRRACHLTTASARRRTFTLSRAWLTVMLIALVACATPVQAQKAKVYRVAFIAAISPVSELSGADPVNLAARAFVHRLRDLGYVEERNLVLDNGARLPHVLWRGCK